jgi:cold shock CspA family protein/ribosome-associated translation inhibitor RaiA
MLLPLEIRFRDMPHSVRLETYIREKAEHLQRFFEPILRCQVMVESPHHHHRVGQRFHVRVHLTVPGEELVVSHDAGREEEHEDARIAVSHALRAMQRQLQDHAKRAKHLEKTHEHGLLGRVAHIVPEEDYGFIATEDGREVFFHRNSVLGGRFDELAVGASVHFVEEQGEEGPQASTVHVA